MGKQLYIQTDSHNHAYVFWLRNVVFAFCDDEYEYEDTVKELSDQGYTFINRVQYLATY